MNRPSRIRTMKWSLAVLALAALSAPGVSAAQGGAPADDGSSFAPVRRGSLKLDTPAVGSFRAAQTSKLGTQVSGRVDAVLVDAGDVVKKGQELVRIDPTFFQIELDQRKADLETAKARVESSKQAVKTAQADVSMSKSGLADAELEMQRMKSLWEKPQGQTPSIPKRMYDDARFKYEQEQSRVESSQSRLAESQARSVEAQSSLKQAEQAVRWAEKRLAETTVRAPYDAVVSARLVDTGEPVTSTPVSHLVEVKQIDKLDLEFTLPQKMLSRVQKGTPIQFEVEGIDGGAGQGQIAVVYPDLDEATRSFRCKVVVDNKDGKFRPGLLVQVHVHDERADALIAPRRALRQGPNGWIVQLKDQPQPQPVEVGLMTDDEAEVRSGLKEGDQVRVPRDE